MGLTNSRNEIIEAMTDKMERAKVAVRHYEALADLVRGYNVAGPDHIEVKLDVLGMIDRRIQTAKIVAMETQSELNAFLSRA